MEHILTYRDAKRVCMCDARALNLEGKQAATFTERNAASVALATSTWLAVLADLGYYDNHLSIFKTHLLYGGLATTVTNCADALDDLLLSLQTPERDYAAAFIATCNRNLEDPRCSNRYVYAAILDIMHILPAPDSLYASVQALSFLERFTFDLSGTGVQVSIDKFKAINGACRSYTHNWDKWPGPVILDALRIELRAIFNPKYWRYDIADARFSSGSIAGGGKTIVRKLHKLSTFRPSLTNDFSYPLSGGGNYGVKGKHWEDLYPNLMEVPKKLTSRRIIAPERVDVAYFGQAALEAIRRIFDKTCMSYINEHDQTVNRDLARLGSWCEGMATIDMSSASDSITRSLFLAAIPGELRSMFENFMSPCCLLPDGKKLKLWMTYTSGNPLTWLTEAGWFLAIGRLACKLCGIKKYRTKVYAYGDDLIVPVEAYETTCELLELLGHTVNRRKSYGIGAFRESCGGWYYNGISITPVFWPRRIVKSGKAALIMTASSLQHSFILAGDEYGFDYNNVDQYLCRVLCELEPKMSVSCVNSRYDDIWDPECGAIEEASTKHIVCLPEKTTLEIKGKDLERIEMYLYVEFLKYGPVYDSELDRLLKVSSSRRESTGVQPTGEHIITWSYYSAPRF